VIGVTSEMPFLTTDKHNPFLEGINTWLVPSYLWPMSPVFKELS